MTHDLITTAIYTKLMNPSSSAVRINWINAFSTNITKKWRTHKCH